MRNKKFKILFLIVILLIISIIGISDVQADTLKTSSTFFSTKTWTGSGYNTNLKWIERSSGSNPIAYCPEFKANAPANGSTIKKFDDSCWSSQDKYVSGQIIKIVRDKYSGDRKKYAMASAALNYYYTEYRKSCAKYSTKDVNSTIKGIANKAKDYYNKYKTGKSLPKITIESKTVLNNTSANNYVSDAITVSGLDSTQYGSVGTKYTTSSVPTYKVTLSTSAGTVKLCTNEAGTTGCISNGETITENGTYYLLISNGGTAGGTASLKISGSNESTYPYANRWIKSANLQKLITLSSKTVSRTANQTISFAYSAQNRYSAAIEKVDETGEILTGAVLKLFTADNDDGTGNVQELCSTTAASGGESCKVSDIEKDTRGFSDGRYICYSESTTPSGYTKIDTHCDRINLSANVSYYYKLNTADENAEEEETTKAAYDTWKSYEQGTDLTYYYSATNSYSSSSVMYKYAFANGSTEYAETSGMYDHTNPETGEVTKYKEENGTQIAVTSETSISGEAVCYNESAGRNPDTQYCQGYRFTEISFTKGNVAISVGNALNSVNISKKAITGDEEVPGATLAIYTATDGKCSSTLATAKRFVYSEYSDASSESEENSTSEETDTTTDDDENDVEGVEDETTVEEDTEETANPASTGLTWISSSTPAIVYGLAVGDYCLKETLPPSGYKLATTEVMFSIDEYGKVITTQTDNYDEDTKTLIIRDELTSISISKTDAATTKELPGAQMKICGAEKDENDKYVEVVDDMGICRPVTLQDGNEAEWTSGTTPHIVEGLGAGAYYLIETTAPNGYSTAESILFILKEDGTLTDANGRSLANNKLVMKDAPIRDVKTGMLTVIITSIICLSAIGIGSYTYLKKLDEPKKTSK